MQAARKPNSVLSDHSSRRAITDALQQPTRRFRHPSIFRGACAPFPTEELFAWARRAVTPSPPEEERRCPCLFGLAPCGVYHAACITADAVGSYPTLSPLPQTAYMNSLLTKKTQQPGAVYFLLHWPYLAPSSAKPRTLSGTLPCGVRTFLPHSTPSGPSGSDRPAACTLRVYQRPRSPSRKYASC